MTPPAGTSYARSEEVDITVTLVDRATGLPVPGTAYTTARDAAGVAGGGLRVASLYVYGPRSKPVPMTGTQAISLFTGGTDANVTTDATGFKYHLTIPSSSTTTPNGTYMVRVRIGDYSRVSDTNYKIESLAFQRFQIGTTTVQQKIDGDACVDCHGTGTAPFHDARHAVVFDSDECVFLPRPLGRARGSARQQGACGPRPVHSGRSTPRTRLEHCHLFDGRPRYEFVGCFDGREDMYYLPYDD